MEGKSDDDVVVVDEVKEAFSRAHDAARRGDPRGMLNAIAETSILDGLARWGKRRWGKIPDDLMHDIIGKAVDNLYEQVRNGQKILDIPAYLTKTIHFKADDLYRKLIREEEFDPTNRAHTENMQYLPEQLSSDADIAELGDEERLKEAIVKARQLLPRLGQENVQKVMETILDAVEAGRVDITNEEIAEVTGLSQSSVRVWKLRGFKRLTDLASKEAGEKNINGLIEWLELED